MLACTQRGCCAPAAAAPPAAPTTSRASRTDSAPDYPANHTTNTSLDVDIAPSHLDTDKLGALARRSESRKDGRETERGSHYSEASSGSCRQSELARSLRTKQQGANESQEQKQHQSSKLSEASQIQRQRFGDFKLAAAYRTRAARVGGRRRRRGGAVPRRVRRRVRVRNPLRLPGVERLRVGCLEWLRLAGPGLKLLRRERVQRVMPAASTDHQQSVRVRQEQNACVVFSSKDYLR